MKATARAQVNIALVKYWGKRDPELNLPERGSISITLHDLGTETTVAFEGGLSEDLLFIDGEKAPPRAQARVKKVLDRLRAMTGVRLFARVDSQSNVPVGAGLASSASASAALAVASAEASGADLPFEKVVELARLGSGSAPRSLLGGFVEVVAGTAADGSDYAVRQIASLADLDIGMVVAITSDCHKEVPSREGMERTKKTSPFYGSFLEATDGLLKSTRQAIESRDIEGLGRLAERSALMMHAAAMAADPPLLYWNPATLAVVHRVLRLRQEGVGCFFTIDAGPNVAVLCKLDQRDTVARALAEIQGVRRLFWETPGPGARLVDGD